MWLLIGAAVVAFYFWQKRHGSGAAAEAVAPSSVSDSPLTGGFSTGSGSGGGTINPVTAGGFGGLFSTGSGPVPAQAGPGAGASAASPSGGLAKVTTFFARAVAPRGSKRSGGFASATLYTPRSTGKGSGYPGLTGVEAGRSSTLTSRGYKRTAGRGQVLAAPSRTYKGNLKIWRRSLAPPVTA